MNVLFVCLGNICRSPLAEAVFNHKVRESKFEFQSDSCGTGAYHIGHQPDPRTIKTAERNGIAIDHFARQLNAQDLLDFDYIVAMDESNHSNILRLPDAGRYKHKIVMMRDFDPVGKGDVPDPYYGTMNDFQEVFEILDRSMDEFLKRIKN